jgi:hypothetical protein
MARSNGSAIVWSPPIVTSPPTGSRRPRGTGLDIGHGLIDGKRVHRQIAGVGHLVHRERMDVERRVEGSE